MAISRLAKKKNERAIAIVFLLAFGVLLFWTPKVWAADTILLQDDFNDNFIDPTKWTTEGTRVFEQDGVMNVNTDVTDHGGELWSKPFSINGTEPITVSRRTLQHYGNDTFVSFFRMRIDVNGDGLFDPSSGDVDFGVNHANNGVVGYDNYCARHGIFLDVITSTSRGGIFCDDTTSEIVPGIWDMWFDEEATYDPISGMLSYKINGVQKATLNVGSLPVATNYRMQLYDRPWGWWTGHYDKFDDLIVTQDDLQPTAFTCGQSTVDDADGNIYGTTDVNGQCWMTENVRVGVMVQGATEQTDNGVIEKYCYNDDPSNCTSDGGLYQWDEAMQHSTTEGVQGICPAGWHVPTDDEWYDLENFLKDLGQSCDAARGGYTSQGGFSCFPAGEKLMSGSVGLNVPLAGQRNLNGVFDWRGTNSYSWSSLQDGDYAWERFMSLYNWGNVNVTSKEISRSSDVKKYGASVRCIKGNGVIIPENHAPEIKLDGDETMTINVGDTFTDPGATASDVEDGDITSKITKSGSVDTSTPGTYIIMYNVKDSKELAAEEVKRTVNVVVNTKSQCSDGIDNDGDKLVDTFDPGCHPLDKSWWNPLSYNGDFDGETKNDSIVGDDFIVDPISGDPYAYERPKYDIDFVQRLRSAVGDGKEYVVVVTHGWNSSSLVWINDRDGEEGMATVINNQIPDAEKTKWVVLSYDWSDNAHQTLPETAYDWAKYHGDFVGSELAKYNLKKIHFIAHSAGSNLIQAALTTMKDGLSKQGKEDPITHMTFLDAYAPKLLNEKYGEGSDYAEQYVDARTIDPAPCLDRAALPFAYLLDHTHTHLLHAKNFDVTSVDENQSPEFDECVLSPFLSYAGRIHAWPIKYYKATIEKLDSPGFPFSLESGKKRLPIAMPDAWCTVKEKTDNLSDYPYECEKSREQVVREQVEFQKNYTDAFVDNVGLFFDATTDLFSRSITGAIKAAELTGNLAKLYIKQSLVPYYAIYLSTGSPVWLSVNVESTEPANVLGLDYDFLPDSSDGLLSVFVDGGRVYLKDETLVDHADAISETIALKDMIQPGRHTVTLRLDPLSAEHVSKVAITNLRFGLFSQEQQVITDTIVPITTISLSGITGNNNWYKSDVSVTLSAADNDGGVGVKDMRYSLDDGATWNTYADPFTISDEGMHTVQFYSEDWFGNKEDTKTEEIKIDKMAPAVGITAPGDGATLYGPVEVRGSVSDDHMDRYELKIEDGSGKVIGGTGIVQGTGSFSDSRVYDWDTTKIPDHDYILELNAFDAAGNQGVKSIRVAVNNTPDNKDQCKDESWKNFFVPVFKNQGDCVSLVQGSPKASGNKGK